MRLWSISKFHYWYIYKRTTSLLITDFYTQKFLMSNQWRTLYTIPHIQLTKQLDFEWWIFRMNGKSWLLWYAQRDKIEWIFRNNDGQEVFHHFLCRSILLLCEFLFIISHCCAKISKNRTVFDAIAKELIEIIHSQLEHQQCSNILRIDDDWIEIKRPNEI